MSEIRWLSRNQWIPEGTGPHPAPDSGTKLAASAPAALLDKVKKSCHTFDKGGEYETIINSTAPVEAIEHCLNHDVWPGYAVEAHNQRFDIRVLDPAGRLPSRRAGSIDHVLMLTKVHHFYRRPRHSPPPFPLKDFMAIFPGSYPPEGFESFALVTWLYHYNDAADPLMLAEHHPLPAALYALRQGWGVGDFEESGTAGKTAEEYEFLNKIEA